MRLWWTVKWLQKDLVGGRIFLKIPSFDTYKSYVKYEVSPSRQWWPSVNATDGEIKKGNFPPSSRPIILSTCHNYTVDLRSHKLDARSFFIEKFFTLRFRGLRSKKTYHFPSFFLNRRCRVFPRQSLLKKKDWIRYRKSVELKVGSFFPVDIHIVNLGEKSFNIFFVVNLFYTSQKVRSVVMKLTLPCATHLYKLLTYSPIFN